MGGPVTSDIKQPHGTHAHTLACAGRNGLATPAETQAQEDEDTGGHPFVPLGTYHHIILGE